MNEPMNPAWPVAELDPVRRMRVMAAAAGAVVMERIIAAPLEAVWTVASDLEHEVPRLGWYVRSLRIVRAHGDRLVLDVRGPLGVRDRFDAVLRPGWCWCQGHVLRVGMAATPIPDGTLFAVAAGLRLPGAGVLRGGAASSARSTTPNDGCARHNHHRISPRDPHGRRRRGESAHRNDYAVVVRPTGACAPRSTGRVPLQRACSGGHCRAHSRRRE